jgi:hypothetical protein
MPFGLTNQAAWLRYLQTDWPGITWAASLKLAFGVLKRVISNALFVAAFCVSTRLMSSSFSYQFFGSGFSGITKFASIFSSARFVPWSLQIRVAYFWTIQAEADPGAVHNIGFDFAFLKSRLWDWSSHVLSAAVMLTPTSRRC